MLLNARTKEASGVTSKVPVALFAVVLLSVLGNTSLAYEGVEGYVAHQNSAQAPFGSLTVHGPMTVRGDLAVGGELTVRGPMTVTRIERLQPDQRPVAATVHGRVIDGPLTLVGSVIVDGNLRVDGPLTVSGVLSMPDQGDADVR